MNDNNIINNQNKYSSDASKMLEDILKTGTKGIAKLGKGKVKTVIIDSKKLSNSFLRGYVKKLRGSNKFTDIEILDFILEMDGKVENGEIKEESFNK